MKPTTESDQEKLKALTAERERWITRIFWLGLEIALIFAIPAALGAWLGTRLGGGAIRSGILVGTFVLSWVIVIVRYRQINAKMMQLDRDITALRPDPETEEE